MRLPDRVDFLKGREQVLECYFWKQIGAMRRATAGEAMGATAVRVASAPSRSVIIHMVDRKLPLVFSVDNEARLISEWERRLSRA